MDRTDDFGQREAAHQAFGAERARVFAGRQALLNQLDGVVVLDPIRQITGCS